MPKLERINLINCVAGYKAAFLAGTVSEKGIENLAPFGSVFHISSNPPILGMVFRPASVPRHTLTNIKKTGQYTLNMFTADIIEQAHHASAKYPEEVSEFEKTGFEPEYKDNFMAPFVKSSPLKLAMKPIEFHTISIKQNVLLVGEIVGIYIRETMLKDDGFVDLSSHDIVGITGLDGYIKAELIDRFPYQRPKS